MIIFCLHSLKYSIELTLEIVDDLLSYFSNAAYGHGSHLWRRYCYLRKNGRSSDDPGMFCLNVISISLNMQCTCYKILIVEAHFIKFDCVYDAADKYS